MAELQLRGVAKQFGSHTAIIDVDLTIPDGQLVCLLGSSGCGKTTLLRVIAGLDDPSSGQVLLDGEDISHLPAHRRNFGMVFQSLALFRHLSVAENIAYSLKIRGVDAATRAKRAADLLGLVQLPGTADRHISQLSGGQRQRVAIARALAVEPAVFLLDEPMSVLDAKLREAMQVELSLLQRRIGVTAIVVTHDQREAMTMADTIVLIGHNRIQLVGDPLEIYRRPRNSFVADFIGSTNLLEGRLDCGGRVKVAEEMLAVGEVGEGLSEGEPATVAVRPEDVHVVSAADSAGENRLAGVVTFVRDLGAQIETHVRCSGGQSVISVSTPKDRPGVALGDQVVLELPASACRALGP